MFVVVLPRRIALEPWQERLCLEEAPWAFIRGLMHSDGCFFINRTGAYGYLSADFRNLSADIRALMCAACDRVGIPYVTTGPSVRFYRREAVRELVTFVGSRR